MKYLIIWVNNHNGIGSVKSTSYKEIENYQKLISWLEMNQHLQIIQILEVKYDSFS